MGLAGHIGKQYVLHCFGVNEARYHTYQLHKVRMARPFSRARLHVVLGLLSSYGRASLAFPRSAAAPRVCAVVVTRPRR